MTHRRPSHFLSPELRTRLGDVIEEVRRVAQAGAAKALEALAVGNPEPHDHMMKDNSASMRERALRNRLRIRGREAGDKYIGPAKKAQQTRHLAHEVSYNHWHRMLFARFLAENDLLIEPEYRLPVSLDDCRDLAHDRGQDHWELAGSWIQEMLPAIFRARDPALATLAPDEDSLRQRVRLSAGGGYDFTYLRFVRTKAEADEGEERTGPWRPVAGTLPDWPRAASELRILDPCCGSGHFLVEAFELLARLRMAEEGLTGAQAARAVLGDNLFGLEIDPRCTQIAAFHVALAAWRMAGGWIELPALNIACSGIEPWCGKTDWGRLAARLEGLAAEAQDPDLFDASVSHARGPLEVGMRTLHGLFSRARELGSLVDPKSVEGELSRADYDKLKKLLGAATAMERKDASQAHAVPAEEMARAARILGGRYTLVVTNVPFLGQKKQIPRLREFALANHDDAKGDLATVFASRIFGWLGGCGVQALVMPQNWLFLKTYRGLRERLLRDRSWHVVARLGTKAFDTPMWDFNIALVILSAGRPDAGWEMMGMDVSSPWGEPPIRAARKARLLAGDAPVVPSVQEEQLANPDARILMEPFGDREMLGSRAFGHQGLITRDYSAFGRSFWEVARVGKGWVFHQSTVKQTTAFGGREHVVHWKQLKEMLERGILYSGGSKAVFANGRGIWNREGVAVSQMGTLPVTRYTGEKFDSNTAALGPLGSDHLPAVWAYCSSPEYAAAVREIDQALKITNATLVKVPFDLEHWTRVAAKRYPRGLPEPYTDDPTQWIFHGDPCRSVIWDERTKQTAPGPTRFDKTVLQVAVARLVGYHWPAELDPDMRLAPEQRALANRCPTIYDQFANTDGIVCIPPVGGELRASDRLRELLIHAYGDDWSAYTEHQLLEAASSSDRVPVSLEAWLRNHFFAQHCKLFHNRPFIWHIWDGHPEGFSALVNYHKLAGPGEGARRTLESLTWAYLNDWLDRQRAEQSEGKSGADARIAHALDLQGQLKRILEGEPPCDLFVRWKPLGAQALGWRPDLDDGVRMNIRPFMRTQLLKGGHKGAGVLRRRPAIHWKKDRGKEPEGPRPRADYPWFWGCPGGGTIEARTDFVAQEQASFDGHRWNDLHYTRAAKEAAREGNGRL